LLRDLASASGAQGFGPSLATLEAAHAPERDSGRILVAVRGRTDDGSG